MIMPQLDLGQCVGDMPCCRIERPPSDIGYWVVQRGESRVL